MDFRDRQNSSLLPRASPRPAIRGALLAESVAAGKLKVVGGEYRAHSGKVLTV